MGPETQHKDGNAHTTMTELTTSRSTPKLNNADTPSSSGRGWRASVQVFGSFLIVCSAWRLVLSFGAFQSFYQFTMLQGYSTSSISWIGSLQSFLLMFTGIITGPGYDLGYHRTLLLLGGFLTVLGMMTLSLCTKYYQILLAQGVCVGLGSGVVYVPSLALVAASFTTKRPVAVAAVSSGISVGSISFLLAFQHLISRLGFAWTTRVMAFMTLGTFAAGIPMVLCRSVQTSGQRRQVFDSGAWKDIPFMTLCVGGFFRFLGYFPPLIFLPLFARTALHLSQEKGIDLVLILSGASIIGRLLGSLIAQRTRVLLPWMLCVVVTGTLCLAWPAIRTFGGAVAFSVLFGIVSGPLPVFQPVVVPLLCPSPAVVGTRMGIVWAFSAVAFLIGSPIGAAVADPSTGNFLGLQLFCGVTLLVGALLLLPLWALIQKKQPSSV